MTKSIPKCAMAFVFASALCAQSGIRGLFPVDSAGRPFFPIGSYELPKDDAEFRAMRQAGINLFVCQNKEQLDRVSAAGAMGWVPLSLQLGRDDKLRAHVESVMNHPALAVWEGPDEIAWNIAGAQPMLARIATVKPRPAWWNTDPGALEDAYEKLAPVIAKFREGAAYVRELDRGRHPIWMNEAAGSDFKLMRDYIGSVDFIGCDIYPIHGATRKPEVIGDYTGRFQSVGQGRPVWMVLQGFAWKTIEPKRTEAVAYPSFKETRMMAYESLTHKASAILYWGTYYAPPENPSLKLPADFRQSLYAMTAEISALEPFLLEKGRPEVRVILTETEGRPRPGDRGVSWTARKAGREWIVVLVNEDDSPHFGVELTGLGELEGRRLDLLYGRETASVSSGGFVTRLLSREVKVFATGRGWESRNRAGRGYAGVGFEQAAP
jgi:hypothetical protein